MMLIDLTPAEIRWLIKSVPRMEDDYELLQHFRAAMFGALMYSVRDSNTLMLCEIAPDMLWIIDDFLISVEDVFSEKLDDGTQLADLASKVWTALAVYYNTYKERDANADTYKDAYENALAAEGDASTASEPGYSEGTGEDLSPAAP